MAVDRIRRLVSREQDLLLAGALALGALIEVWTADALTTAEQLSSTPLVFVATLSLIWRRRVPLAVLAVLAISFFVGSLVIPLSGEDPTAPAIAVAVALYSVGAHASGIRAAAGLVATLGFVIAAVANDPDPATPGSYVFFGLVVGGPWAAGRAIRYRRLSERRLERRAASAERGREERARAAVAEERSRIARELHDVVAHAISVIVVQARGGRRSLADEPEEAREAFDAIEATGAQALAEMRRLLGLLRRDEAQLTLSPQPSLASLRSLAAQVSEAGLPVEVTVEGEQRELPPGVDLSAFRIVQEALTNALKHAGPATARVVVRYGKEALELEIFDTGSGLGSGDGGGHGLVGMRERATLYGGELTAGRRSGGGFGVRVRLPLAADGT
jgi:signal transduction histidine kinase